MEANSNLLAYSKLNLAEEGSLQLRDRILVCVYDGHLRDEPNSARTRKSTLNQGLREKFIGS